MSEILDSLIFDRVQEDLDNLTQKAYIDYADLNRIEGAVKWVSYVLNRYGYKNTTHNKLNWKMNDFRTEKEMERLRDNIAAIRAAYYTPDSTPLTPERITYTSIYQANAIEKIIYDIGTLIETSSPGMQHLSFRLGAREQEYSNMSLKTDYKNDIFTGKRKYQITNNADGTVSLDDVTDYVQEGDILSADDVNAINKAVNELQTGSDSFQEEITGRVDDISGTAEALTGEVLLTLRASRWSDTAPYTQKVAFVGINETDIPIYGLRLTGTLSNVTVEAQKLAWGYVDRIASGDDVVTAYCYSKKPVTDIVVSAKGVKHG
mgnify:CR=1 FL=1